MKQELKYIIHLTYFKPSGKYYSEGSFGMFLPVDYYDWLVHDEVKKLREAGNLPGLVEGAREFIVLITGPVVPHVLPLGEGE